MMFAFVTFFVMVGKSHRNGLCNRHFYREFILSDLLSISQKPNARAQCLTGTCKNSIMQQNGANFAHDHETTSRQQKINGRNAVSQ